MVLFWPAGHFVSVRLTSQWFELSIKGILSFLNGNDFTYSFDENHIDLNACGSDISPRYFTGYILLFNQVSGIYNQSYENIRIWLSKRFFSTLKYTFWPYIKKNNVKSLISDGVIVGALINAPGCNMVIPLFMPAINHLFRIIRKYLFNRHARWDSRVSIKLNKKDTYRLPLPRYILV